jgi:hypothetical protein
MDFGEVVLRFLELKSAIKRDEVAEKPEKFAKELEDLLGDSAKIIEEKMTQRLYAKTGMDYVKKEGYTFQTTLKTHIENNLDRRPPHLNKVGILAFRAFISWLFIALLS